MLIYNKEIGLLDAVLFLIPFCIFYVPASLFFPYITGRHFMFWSLITVSLLFFVLNGNFKITYSKILTALIIYFIVVGFTSMLGMDFYHSYWSEYERMDGFLGLIYLFIYFCLLKFSFKEKHWTWFLAVFSIVSVLEFIFFAVKEHKFGGLGTVGNSAYLGAYFLMSVIISFILYSKSRKKIWLLPVIIGSIMVYLSTSRGMLLALLTGLFIYMLFQNRKFFIIASLITLFFIMPLYSLKDPTISRVLNISKEDPTTKFRLLNWQMAVEGIKEKPLLGWGYSNYTAVYNKYYKKELFGIEAWADKPHNKLLEVAIDSGIIGLLAYLGIFGSVIYVINRAYTMGKIKKQEFSALLGGLSAYFVQNLFIFDTFSTYLTFFTILAYADSLE